MDFQESLTLLPITSWVSVIFSNFSLWFSLSEVLMWLKGSHSFCPSVVLKLHFDP